MGLQLAPKALSIFDFPDHIWKIIPQQFLGSVFEGTGSNYQLTTVTDAELLILPDVGVSVQFRSVQDGIYALGKVHMRSTLSLRSFPSVVLKTVPMLV